MCYAQKMHVVLVHFEAVPVLHYGGTERVVEALAQGLIEAGHKVSLIAFPGEYPLPGVNFIALQQDQDHLSQVLKLIPHNADIVHFHLPIGEKELQERGVPYVCTLHGNEQFVDRLPQHCIFLTAKHAHNHGRSSFVFNGLDPAKAPLSKQEIVQRDYFAFLGRASLKRKGLHLAKQIAKQLKTPLHVGGGRGLSIFNTKYLGHLDDSQKYKLLAGSRGLLFPILWEEPFGLVLIEAMFCGTPVFALNRGSVGEVLAQTINQDYREMFCVADSVGELVNKISHFSYRFSPADYREYAIKFFSYQQMTAGYLAKYQEIIAGKFVK